MIQSIYLLEGTSGDVIIEKHYKGMIGRAPVEAFWEEVAKRQKRDDVPPVLVSSKYYLVSIYRDNMYFLAAVTGEIPALFVVEFLHRVFDVYRSYFGDVSPRSLTDNFSVSYQLLEEMLDNGYPLITEPNALNTLIAPPSVLGKMAAALTGKSGVSETIGEGAMSIIPWRRAGVSYAQNEIYFDIVEEIDAIQEANGSVVSHDVRGVVSSKCSMSGTPDLTLFFANPSIIEDCSFHPCVRYARYEREQVVSFVPPDGAFTLMTYRVADRTPQAPVFCRPQVTWREGAGRASFTVGSKPMRAGPTGSSTNTRTGGISSSGAVIPAGGAGGAGAPGAPELVVEDVRLVVTFPKAVKTVDMSADVGSIHVDPKSNELTWTIGRLPVGRSPELVGALFLAPGASTPLESVSAVLHFTVPNATVSGLAVRDLALVNEKYKFFKGVRTLLRTGRYQIRT